MYFDKVNCSTCGASFAPEAVRARGEYGSCPACGSSLRLKDLFGRVDSVVEPDEDPVSMDDLVSAPTWRPDPSTARPEPPGAPRAEDAEDAVTRDVLAMLADIRRERGD